MQNRKKYYLNVSSYKYKREYMKLYQPNIDKILNTYSNNNQDIIIESQNLCPAGKRCKNYLIIMNLEQKIKALNDTVNQLTKIKEYSETNHNIDFTPLKTMENNRKDTFNEICNSFRNSGIKKKLNTSTRNAFGNNTLQPQISEPYRLKLDNKNINNEKRINENKKLKEKKNINLDINKFKNVGVRLNAEKLAVNEKFFLNKSEENNEIKNNNSFFDEKEKKIQNLLNHIFNNKSNELIVNKKLEEDKNREKNIKKGGTKTVKKINIPKIKVKSYNLFVPNKINKINNKRYNLDLDDKDNKKEPKDENLSYFRKFKGELKNSFNSTKNKFLSKSLGFCDNSKEENTDLNYKYSKTLSEDKKQSLYKLNLLNEFRPLTHNQKPFKLKLNIGQNEENKKEEKSKSERKVNDLMNIEEKILLSNNPDIYQFESFLNLFENKNTKNYKLFEEIYDLSNENYETIIEKLNSLPREKLINDYLTFIKYSFNYMKDLLEIYHKLKTFYNITNSTENNNHTIKDKKSINNEFSKYRKIIQQILLSDNVRIYLYDPSSDLLILKGEKEELHITKDKDLIGQCFSSGKPIKYKINDNSYFGSDFSFIKQNSLTKDDKLLFYPLKDIENNIHGVIEVMKKNADTQNPEDNYILDKKNEIIISFISKFLGICCFYYNYIN